MAHNERSPWQGLTRSQLAQLNAAEDVPQRKQMDTPEAYYDIAREFEHRAAVALVSNDLYGALSAAEIAAAATNIARTKEQRQTEARLAVLRIRAMDDTDPAGQLVYNPGHRRRKRVYPGDSATNG